MTAQLDWITPAPRRTSTAASHARRQHGMARTQEAAEREHGDDWTERAATYLRSYAVVTACRQPFLLEDAREASARHVPPPPNLKAWGPAATYAERQGWLVKAGYGAARSSNGSPKRTWRAA